MSVALECRTARCRRTRVRSGAQTLQKSSTVLILLQKGQISYWNILIGTPCNKPALAIDDMGFCAQKASACAQMRASALVTLSQTGHNSARAFAIAHRQGFLLSIAGPAA